MSLADYQRHFSSLRVNMRGKHASPHKVAMLLAVIELIEAEEIEDNRIYFDARLLNAFSRHFANLATETDSERPHLPFFHLRSSSFWHHKVRGGAEFDYGALSTARGPGELQKVVSYAYLDEELFEILGFPPSRAVLHESLMRNLSGSEVREQLQTTGWDWIECEILVADYFAMLSCELRGERYSKSEHRETLLASLRRRNKGSIEFKHQNVSAILVELGEPYITGYKPRFNYQAQLRAVVRAHLAARRPSFEAEVVSLADSAPERGEVDWARVLDPEVPERLVDTLKSSREYRARQVNYAAREARNRKLGERGEEFALEYERYRLGALLRGDLADRVEWSSREVGDGLGYDIKSFDPGTGNDRFIEVKTTNSGKYTTFYVSANEVAFSQDRSPQYSLYRVFEFRDRARLFTLEGSIDQHVNLEPNTYKANF